MDLKSKLNDFKLLPTDARLDSWQKLYLIGDQFLKSPSDFKMGADIAHTILYHRSLMGSSKAYESAIEIELQLCELSFKIAKIVFTGTEKMLPFLDAAQYYSTNYPQMFSKEDLEEERRKIRTN